MAIKLGEIFVSLGLSTASFTRGLNDMKKVAFGSSKEIQRSFEIMGKALITAGASAAAALAFLTSKQIDAAAQANKLSQRFGVAVETISGLSHVAKVADVDTNTLGVGLRNLARFMVASGEGSKDVKEKFFQLADQFANTRDGATKTAMAVKIFGKAGDELIPMLNMGRAGLEALWREAEQLGAVIDTKTAVAAERLKDTWQKLGFAVEGVGNRFARQVIPDLQRTGDMLVFLGKSAHPVKDFFSLMFTGDVKKFEERLGQLQRAALTMDEMFKIGRGAAARLGPLQGGLRDATDKAKALKVELLDLATFGGIPGRAEGEDPTLLRGGEVTAAIFRGLLQPEIRTATEALRDFGAEARGIWEETRTPFEQFGIGMARLDELFASGALDVDTYHRAVAALEKRLADFKVPKAQLTEMAELMAQLKEHTMQWANTSAGALANWIVGGGSFREVLAGIIKDFARMLAQMLIMRALKSIFGGLFAAEGAVIPGAAFGAMIPAMAGGGPAFGRGPFLVGERGPEIFMPPRSGGMIIPNDKIPGFGGGVVINQAVDARGADLGVVTRVNAAMIKANNRLLVEALRERQLRTVA